MPDYTSRLVRVRNLVLDDHAMLRAELERLELCAIAIDAGGGVNALAGERLRRAACAMSEHFERHLAYEDSRLVPLIAKLDDWGAGHARAMRKDHHEQREALVLIKRASAIADALTLAKEVHEFVTCLRADMNGEERDLRLLLEDMTEVGACTG